MPESHRTVELNITPASYFATISLKRYWMI